MFGHSEFKLFSEISRMFSTQVFLLIVSVDARMEVSSLFHLMGDLVMLEPSHIRRLVCISYLGLF